MEIKLPVKWLREKGIEILYAYDEGDHNFRCGGENGYITSFADRENKGKQPVKGWVPVAMTFTDETEVENTASTHYWALKNRSDGGQNIYKWKPNAKALMEIYTAEQSAKLTEPKKETKLKLTKDDVGKEFEIGSGSVFKSLYFKNEQSVLEGPVGDLHVCDSYGYMDSLSVSIIKRHEPRWWLKDMPDAGAFILFEIKWLACIGGCWHAHQDEPIFNNDHFQYDSHMATILNRYLMPQLKGDEWELSKISIDDLREWQKENK